MNQIELFERQRELANSVPERMPLFKRLRDPSWDFRGIQASTGVYGIHPYPAMFHFRVVRQLLLEFSNEKDLVLDPFLGSGVAAVESRIHGRRFVGYDINPLAHLITQVRTTPLPKPTLVDGLQRLETGYQGKVPETVEFHNIDYWFDEQIIENLSRLRAALREMADARLQAFFKVVFSEVVRRASRTSYNEFKLVRKKGEHKPLSVWKTFRDVSLRNMALLTDFYKNQPSSAGELTLLNANILGSDLEPESVDLAVTSPPYGDSRTTVAYGQFSRLSLRWLGLEEHVDRTSLGSKAKEIAAELPSEVLYEYLNKIAARDEKRAREVFAFYDDLYAAIGVIAAKIKPHGHVCFVVGNRTVKGEQLPTDKISADFFESRGFRHQQTFVRAISNKRMPNENSPSNVKGAKDSTMRYEYLVILKKSG